MLPVVANAVFDAVGVRIDQVRIYPHMIFEALQAKAKGEETRFGAEAFPEADFGETLVVPIPTVGGDCRAINDYRERLRGGMRSSAGTMLERKEALKPKDTEVLTTKEVDWPRLPRLRCCVANVLERIQPPTRESSGPPSSPD